MHASNLLVFLALMAFGALNQWMKKRKKDAARPPEPGRPAPVSREDEDEDDFAARPEPARPAPASRSAGQDILAQLAKELGLQIPTPPPPAPPARHSNTNVTPARSPQSASAPSPRHARLETPLPAETATRRPETRPAASSRRPETPAPIEPLPQASVFEAAPVSDEWRPNLSDPAALRQAFILKTILDRPLSLRPRRPGD